MVAQRFTGEDIYNRVGRWCMDRLRRDIPTVATYHSYLDGHNFINTIAAVPYMSVPPGVRVRTPDEVDVLGGEGVQPWVLLTYQSIEDA